MLSYLLISLICIKPIHSYPVIKVKVIKVIKLEKVIKGQSH